MGYRTQKGEEGFQVEKRIGISDHDFPAFNTVKINVIDSMVTDIYHHLL